ncbi:MAG: PqqD family protein [Alphaproteobacteria bacterium]|jgi:hypothetical protein
MNRYRRRPGINETPVEDEVFLMTGEDGDIFHLDQMAMSIWRALKQPASQADLLALFTEAFPETSADVMQRDLEATLSTLLQGELIEVCD